jgi:hypothetical protein
MARRPYISRALGGKPWRVKPSLNKCQGGPWFTGGSNPKNIKPEEVKMTCVSLQFDCDVTSALITAGNTFLVPEVSATQQAWFPEAEELLAIDAMSGPNYKSLSFAKAVVELAITSPTGCVFAVPGTQAPFIPCAEYEMDIGGGAFGPFIADASHIRVSRWDQNGPITLNDSNSSSFWLGIKGRSGAPLDVKVTVMAIGSVMAEARSCQWEVKGLTPANVLGGRFCPSCG